MLDNDDFVTIVTIAIIMKVQNLIQIELKSGRIPDGINRRMGFWKAEEYQKFTFPASELILDGVIPEENYQAWILIVHITELIFNTCRSGWTSESVEML